GDQLQRLGDDRRQAAQRLQLLPVATQLGKARQAAVHQQVRDFLEARAGGQVGDVVAAVVQVVAAAADRAKRGIARRRARQGNRLLRLRQGGGFAHGSSFLSGSAVTSSRRTARPGGARTRGSRCGRTAPRGSA